MARARQQAQGFIDNSEDQVVAGARGAEDALTFGAGDYLNAGVRALGGAAQGQNIGQAYSDGLDMERARDQYDAAHHPAARLVGQVIGTGAQLAALGPLEGAVAGGARMAQATRLIPREIAAIGGAGGAAGVGGQAISDLARGHLSSLGDYAGAGVGGAVGGLASMGGRGSYAGAADGVATSLSQDLFNGRTPSLDRARQAAGVGGTFGAIGGVLGRFSSNANSGINKGIAGSAKDKIGEDFSQLRTLARGDTTISLKKTREYFQNRKYTYPDQRTASGQLVESKFGRTAKLSDPQKGAHRHLSNYRVDHTLPQDVGVLFATPAWAIGGRYLASNNDSN